jgi:hypothetical protein
MALKPKHWEGLASGYAVVLAFAAFWAWAIWDRYHN